MRTTCLEAPEDLDWLFSGHLARYAEQRATTVIAVLYGNEDAPSSVCCYPVNDYRCAAVVFEPDADGNLILQP